MDSLFFKNISFLIKKKYERDIFLFFFYVGSKYKPNLPETNKPKAEVWLEGLTKQNIFI